jgi:type I restriction enzyme M protein
LRFEDLQEFIKCYSPDNRHKRKETWSDKKPEGRFRRFTYKEILERDKTSLDIFWLKDKSLTDLDSLPDPELIAAEIMENLETALGHFKALITNLDTGDK